MTVLFESTKVRKYESIHFRKYNYNYFSTFESTFVRRYYYEYVYSTSLRGMGFEVVYDVGSLLGTALYMYVYAYVYVDYVCNARV